MPALNKTYVGSKDPLTRIICVRAHPFLRSNGRLLVARVCSFFFFFLAIALNDYIIHRFSRFFFLFKKQSFKTSCMQLPPCSVLPWATQMFNFESK